MLSLFSVFYHLIRIWHFSCDSMQHAVTPSAGSVSKLVCLFVFDPLLRLLLWPHLTDHNLKEHKTLGKLLSCKHRLHFMKKEEFTGQKQESIG